MGTIGSRAGDLINTPGVFLRLGCLILTCLVALAAAETPSAPEALVESGHFKRARAIVEPVLQKNPNDAEAAYLLSEIKQAYGDLEAATTLAEKALSLDAKNARYHFQLAQLYGQAAQKAGIFKQLGLVHKFKSESETALSIDPNFLDAREGMMEFYLQAPGIIGGDRKKAQTTADEIGKINAVRGFLAQARLAQVAKDASAEEAARLKAVQADSHDYNAAVSLAGFYTRPAAKKYDLAEKYYHDAQRIDLGRAGAYAGLALIYAEQQRWNDLDALLARSEKEVPDNFVAFYQAGKALLLQDNDLPRAERYFRKYITQEPEGANPNLAAAHWRLGLVLEKQGRKNDAISEIQTAVNLSPDFDPAKKDLKRLR
jgi:tetratricopeptide (TPR) repeat protein